MLFVGVVQSDRQQTGAEEGQRVVNPFPKWPRETQLAELNLDAQFPNGPNADQPLVRFVLDGLDGRKAQLRGVVHRPNHGVRVEQQLHSMYSLKSSKGASKSGAM